MSTILATVERLMALSRVGFVVAAAVLLVVFLGDWLVRTRRVNPFGPVGRFFRRSVDPLIAPVERRVVRAGGMPHTAPWWALVVVVVAGIIVLTLLDWLARWLAGAALSAQEGTMGVVRFVVITVFGIVQIALIVRVVASWVRISEWSPWIRWTVTLTEPILGPLRRVVPPLGGAVDLSPLIAWFLLDLLQGAVVSYLR